MNYKIPGLSSFIIILLAIIVADVWLFIVSLFAGIIYAVITPVLFYAVFHFYCRKCSHKADNSCRHFIPGKIAPRYKTLKPEQPINNKISSKSGKYSSGEMLITLLSLLIIFAFPQYWLFRNPVLLLFFWLSVVSAGIIIRAGVCPKCRNSKCAFCSSKKFNNT